MFETPILFIIFNRPDTTRQVFEAIRRQKPKYLYVAADGPRPGNIDDIEKCKAVRNIINVDWDCKLFTLFRDQNRGCGYGPAEAITWFFDNVERGIILEDDCLPAPDFFLFCEKMLERHEFNCNISVISGTNQLVEWRPKSHSCFLSKYGSTWGWATWKRAWEDFDHSMSNWHTYDGVQKVKRFLSCKKYFEFYESEFNIFSNVERMKDVWDYQWLFSRFFHSRYAIVPACNLVANIGFGEDSHHTKNPQDKMASIMIKSLPEGFDKKDPVADPFFDWLVFELLMTQKIRPFHKRVILKIARLIFNIA
jgi:hypothetical protein